MLSSTNFISTRLLVKTVLYTAPFLQLQDSHKLEIGSYGSHVGLRARTVHNDKVQSSGDDRQTGPGGDGDRPQTVGGAVGDGSIGRHSPAIGL